MDFDFSDDNENVKNNLTDYDTAIARIKRAVNNHATTLDLSFLNLSELPHPLGYLTQLQELRLDFNEITELPSWIGQLKQLRRLHLEHNRLQQLPASLLQFSQLQELYLEDNQLKELPKWLGNLTQLRQLDLRDNQLTALPDSLATPAHLQSLLLDGNPLNPEFQAAYQHGTEAVKQYLSELGGEQTPLYEAKLIIVGEGGVGKSSLLGALRGDDWDDSRDTTHGIEIKPIALTEPNSQIKLTLNGWDFGGQPVYRPTHQLFFSAPAIYIVVWKPREGPEQGFVDYWIKLIRYRTGRGDAKILIVATHGGPKQRQAHLDEEIMRSQYGDMILGFHHIESKQGYGLAELKNAIAQAAVELPHVGRKYPAKWQKVRQALSVREDAYLDYAEFQTVCRNRGLNEQQAELFANVSHTLGLLIYYGDDPNLKDIVVLQADWLSKAISFVLEDEQTKRQYGLVRHQQLRQLWDDPSRPHAERYPDRVHPLFLRLMERFDISYRIATGPMGKSKHDDASLIAQLVPASRPALAGWEKEAATSSSHNGELQQTQICQIVDEETGHSTPAEGLFYQLIVRLHHYSLGRDNYEKSKHWQRGLLLEDSYHGRALLERVGNDVQIRVRAAYPGFFMRLLTREVKWLVENFWKGLRCQIMLPCIAPCGRGKPGLGLFEVEKLFESRQRKHREYPCSIPGCNQWHNIDELLMNISDMKISEHGVQKILTDGIDTLQAGQEKIKHDLRKLMSQADERFTVLMQILATEAKDGPRLFNLIPLDRGFLTNPNWTQQRFRLTLWCEHSRQPLPLLNGDNSCGVYRIKLPRAYVIKLAPYVQFLTETMNLMLPNAFSTTTINSINMNNRVYEAIKKELALTQKSFDMILKQQQPRVTNSEHDPDNAESIGSLLRKLHIVLKKYDPEFGQLIRVQNQRNEFLWIHHRFIKEYYPDLPVIADTAKSN